MKQSRLMRLLCCILAFFTLSGLFCACAKTEEQPTDTLPVEVTEAETDVGLAPEYTPDLDDADFGGQTFSFFVQNDPSFVHFYDINVEKTTGEPVNDAVYNRNRTIEERYKVKIEDYQTGGDAVSKFRALMQTGDDEYNAVWFRTDYFFSLMLDGQFIELSGIPNINYSKYYWDQNAVDDYMVHGKLYGLMGDISTSGKVFTHLFGVNKKLATDHGISIEDLYQTVFDGKWTVDAFVEICQNCLWADLNGNGERDGEDQFAFGTSPSLIFGAFSAAGEKWIIKDDEGNFTLSELTDRKIAVIERIVEIANDKNMTVATWNIGTVPGMSDTFGYTYRTKFINNTILFSDLDMGEVLDHRGTMENDFGIVPLPKYDMTQTEYSVFAYPFYPLVSVPTTLRDERKAMTGQILEALCAESYVTLTPEFYGVAMGSKVLCDAESVRMLDIILRSQHYELLLNHTWGGNTFRGNIQGVIDSGGKIASAYKSGSRSVLSDIKKVNNQTDKLK